MKIYHLNCVKIETPLGSAIGHCVLIDKDGNLVLIDTGIGLAETKNPNERLGKELVEQTGYIFDEAITAISQVKKLGYEPEQVKDIICSHLDPDHIGGLADFPNATVHVSKEELDSFHIGDPRYLPQQMEHNPVLKTYIDNDANWFVLPARKLEIDFEMYLTPLFGHTAGHCGVAFKDETGQWIFYAGDTYYLKAELNDTSHPVGKLASLRAVDDVQRIHSLNRVRNLLIKHGSEINSFCYHDPAELPHHRRDIPKINSVQPGIE